MTTGRKAGQGRRPDSVPALIGALLLAACILAAVLPAAASAAGEPSWEERLAEAREKYNAKSVHVFRKGKGKWKRGKFNVCFYASKDKGELLINIRDSLKITDEAEMEAILEIVTESEYYDEDVYGTVSFMKAEWIAHNAAHSMATGSEEQRSLISAVMGESIQDVAGSAEELDLSPLAGIPARDRFLYGLVELVCRQSGE